MSDHQPRAARPSADPPPLTVYDATSELARPGRFLQGLLRDLWAGRELAWRLFVRNLRGMYRQTLLGVFWIFLPPLANTAIWVFLRSRKAFAFDSASAFSASNGAETSVTAYILAGMVLWQAFIEAFLMPLESLNRNRGMITKLNFPRESLVLEGTAEVLFNLLIRTVVLIPGLLLFGVALQPLAWLVALPCAVLLVLLGVGMGLLIAPVGSLYQDVGRFLTMAAPFWMILTPIIYVLPPDHAGSLLNWLNPASPLLVLARDLMVPGVSAHWMPGMVFAALTLPVLLLGLVVWRISIPALVERMTS